MGKSEKGYESLKINIRLGSDIILNNSLRLDALLVGQAVPPDLHEIDDTIEIPVRKAKIDKKWFWDCSNSLCEIENRTIDVRKKNIITKGLQKERVNIGSGKYTAKYVEFERLQLDSVLFYVHGDRDGILELLSGVSAIGAYRKDGFGLITDIDIEKADRKMSFYDEQNGVTLRDVPCNRTKVADYLLNQADGFDVKLKQGRYRPPYFPSYNEGKSMLIAEQSKVPLECIDWVVTA